jgi:hypothetical protein
MLARDADDDLVECSWCGATRPFDSVLVGHPACTSCAVELWQHAMDGLCARVVRCRESGVEVPRRVARIFDSMADMSGKPDLGRWRRVRSRRVSAGAGRRSPSWEATLGPYRPRGSS